MLLLFDNFGSRFFDINAKSFVMGAFVLVDIRRFVKTHDFHHLSEEVIMSTYAQFAADCTGRIYTARPRKNAAPDPTPSDVARGQKCLFPSSGLIREIPGFDTRKGFVAVPRQSKIFWTQGRKWRYSAILIEETLPGDYIYDRHKVYPEPDKRVIYMRYDIRALEGDSERIVYRARISPLEIPQNLVDFGKVKIKEREF